MRFLAAASALGLTVLSGAVQADWGGQASLSAIPAGEPAAVFVSPDRPLVAMTCEVGGKQRIFVAGRGAAGWTPLGGAPADEGLAVDHRWPALAADGAGHAMLCYSRYTGKDWKLFARSFDGTAFSDMNSGLAVAPGLHGNSSQPAAAFLSTGNLLLVFIQQDGAGQPVLRASVCNNGIWTMADGGEPLSDALGFSDSPSVAAAPGGRAVVAWANDSGGRPHLFAAAFDGSAWTKLYGGAALDRDDLGTVWKPAATVLPGGRIVIAYLQEGANGIQRAYAVCLDGGMLTRVNAGAPLDASPRGVSSVAIAPVAGDRVVVVYSTFDQTEDGSEAPWVRSVLIEGTSVRSVNGGGNLQVGVHAAIGRVAVAASSAGAAVMAFCEQDDSSVLVGRSGAFDLSGGAGAASPVLDEGVTAVHNVFKPGQGERVRVVCQVDTTQNVRLSMHSLSGELVRVLVDGQLAAGSHRQEWNGRNGNNNMVAAGVYLLVAQARTFNSINKVVVVR